MANLVNEFIHADWLWRKIPEGNKIGLSVSLFLFCDNPTFHADWTLVFFIHTRINTKWISILAGYHSSNGFFRFSHLDFSKENAFVHIATSGCDFLVAFCMVCLEAWLKFSYVKTHQNQNGSRQRR
jgi:hypothetical protein